MPVYSDINANTDNPAGEDLTDVNGAQHSGTNGLVHFNTWQLDANQVALQLQLLGNGRSSRRPEVRTLRRLPHGSRTPPSGTRS